MRTKTLLVAAAALAAGLASTMAQAVYSQNVVGYVNKSFQQFAFTLVCNPLQATNDTLNTIIPNPPAGSAVFRWNVGLQDVDPVIPSWTGSAWSPNASISPGEAFFVVAGDNFTNTFVGEVRQGALSIPLVGGLAFEAIGAVPPVGGSLTNVLAQYPAGAGDAVFIWNVGLQDVDPAIPSWTGSAWSPDANVAVGDGFFLVRQGGPVNYVRNFTVN